MSCWLGICLPQLPLEVFTRGAVCADAHASMAVCEHRSVLLASDAASAAGVHPGLRQASALALCPDLQIFERAPDREREALDLAACWALQFTPSVSLQSDALDHARANAQDHRAGLLLEIGPSLRLFGGRTALLEKLRAGFLALGFSVSIGAASNPAAAWLFALHSDGLCVDTEHELARRIASLPIALLPATTPHLDTLSRIGVHTLGDLTRLPRAGLARRFGKSLLEAADRALGRLPEPRRWYEAPPTFRARLELMADVEVAQALLFGAQRLLLQLCGWLGARQAATAAFALLAEHDDAPMTVFPVRLSEPTRDSTRMARVLRELLGTHRLRAAVHTLHLACDTVVIQPHGSAELFPTPSTDTRDFGQLVERLQARLGRSRVQRLLLAADHRPEAAYRIEAFDAVTAPASPRRPRGRTEQVERENATAAPSPESMPHGMPRPLWLLEPPLAIGERNNRPFWHGPLTTIAGPERIESGWWDGRRVQRDYFIASDEAGVLLWIYRERMAGTESAAGWFLQGRFG